MFGTKNGYDIFLGGTTNGSKWRDEFLQIMKETDPKIKAFNPVVPNWTQECIDLENFVKNHATYHVYVLTPRLVGYYSIAEMVESVHMKDKKVFFYIQEDDIDDAGNTINWSLGPRNSLTVIANLLKSHGASEADNLKDLVNMIVIDYKMSPKPRMGLLK